MEIDWTSFRKYRRIDLAVLDKDILRGIPYCASIIVAFVYCFRVVVHVVDSSANGSFKFVHQVV